MDSIIEQIFMHHQDILIRTLRNLRSAPPKILFVISCILFLACIPVRWNLFVLHCGRILWQDPPAVGGRRIL